MASTARLYADEHQPLSPKQMAQAAIATDRQISGERQPVQPTERKAAHVTVLHSNASAPVNKARKPRAKVQEKAPVQMSTGSQAEPRSTPAPRAPAAMPVTGHAPSLLRSEDVSMKAAPSVAAEPTTSASGTHVDAAPIAKQHRSAASMIARFPGFVVDAAVWSKNVLVGSGVAFMERVPEVLSPVAFVFANLITIVLGLAYCALPAVMGLFVLSHSVVLHEALVVSGPMKVVYMGFLYVACAFVAMVGAFALRAFAMGIVRSLNGFANKGRDAFADQA